MTKPGTPKKRAAELRSLIREADRAYYQDAAPVMSDREYDELMNELIALEAEHPELRDDHSPTARVGGEPIEGFETVRHTVPMRSIDNTYSIEDLRNWADRTFRVADRAHDKDVREAMSSQADYLPGFLGEGEPPLVEDDPEAVQPVPEFGERVWLCDPKIDGVALSLRYERGMLERAITRGDGEKGDDVTHAART
ncbi:MAG: hypothetical protein AAGI17_05255, partial [Planctomycetota bacterium]